MFGKWQQRIPYTFFNPTICFSRLRTWNIRVDRDPGAWKDCYKTTPNDIPDWPTVREVGTMTRCQRAVVDGRDGAGINKGSLNKVVDKNDKQHFKDRCEKGQANVGLMWQKAHRNVDVWPIRQPYRRALQINKRHNICQSKSSPNGNYDIKTSYPSPRILPLPPMTSVVECSEPPLSKMPLIHVPSNNQRPPHIRPFLPYSSHVSRNARTSPPQSHALTNLKPYSGSLRRGSMAHTKSQSC